MSASGFAPPKLELNVLEGGLCPKVSIMYTVYRIYKRVLPAALAPEKCPSEYGVALSGCQEEPGPAWCLSSITEGAFIRSHDGTNGESAVPLSPKMKSMLPLRVLQALPGEYSTSSTLTLTTFYSLAKQASYEYHKQAELAAVIDSSMPFICHMHEARPKMCDSGEWKVASFMSVRWRAWSVKATTPGQGMNGSHRRWLTKQPLRGAHKGL